MGASVRIDADAFTDYRFDVLAQLLGLPDADCARGKMLTIWRYCTQTQRHVIPVAYAVHVLGIPGPSALINSKLGVKHPQGIRVKGTKGRIEWLAKLRAAGHLGAKHGKKGGRPKKTPTGVITNRIEKPLGGLHQKPLPAPAPAPVQDQDQTPPIVPPNVGGTPRPKPARLSGSHAGRWHPPEDLPGFCAFWKAHPFPESGRECEKLWRDGCLEPDSDAIVTALNDQLAWQKYRGEGLQYLPRTPRYLRREWWTNPKPKDIDAYIFDSPEPA